MSFFSRCDSLHWDRKCHLVLRSHFTSTWRKVLILYHWCHYSFHYACSFTVLSGARTEKLSLDTILRMQSLIHMNQWDCIEISITYAWLYWLYKKKYIVLHWQLFRFNQLQCMHTTSPANIELYEAQKIQSASSVCK
jgi:hypothetical protein